MDLSYLQRTAGDLRQRVSSLVVNNQTVPIKSVVQTSTEVIVITDLIEGITRISSIKLLDERGDVITVRETKLDVVDDQDLQFRFNFNVKGGTS